jgi:hypothetical protein
MAEGMTLPVQRWFACINTRKSRRRFLDRKPEPDILDPLARLCDSFRPFPEVRMVLVDKKVDDVFTGIVGSYGRIGEAPLYAAFIGDIRSRRVQEATGYTGEGFILEATALGLATCWVAGFFDPRKVSRDISLKPHEKPLAVTPVGFGAHALSMTEKVMGGLIASHKRKALSALVEGRIEEPWMQEALEAARLAPSAVNRQPWRFRISEGGIDIRQDIPGRKDRISRRLDCGIAMLHLELGARKAGAEIHWEFLDFPHVARLGPGPGR